MVDPLDRGHRPRSLAGLSHGPLPTQPRRLRASGAANHIKIPARRPAATAAHHLRLQVERFTGDELAAALGESRRAVKVALLDQRAVAGIGNIYAAEILFRCGVDPRSRCRRLKQPQWDRIAEQTRRVLAEAVRHEGSSIGDETYRTADNRVGRFQRRHRVYGREGEPCTSCGNTIVRIVQTQRATFFCPACQRRP